MLETQEMREQRKLRDSLPIGEGKFGRAAESLSEKYNQSSPSFIKDGDGIIIEMLLENGNALATRLSLKDAIILEDRLSDLVKELQNEIFNIQIVPPDLKLLIDCGKISRLEYSVADQRLVEDADNGDTTLYIIKAVFNKESEGKKIYYIKTKFFEDKVLLKRQLDYINNIPVIFKDSVPPNAEIIGSTKGYNIGSINVSDEKIVGIQQEEISGSNK